MDVRGINDLFDMMSNIADCKVQRIRYLKNLSFISSENAIYIT